MAQSVPRPRPQATFRPIEQMIFINPYYTTSSGSHRVICSPNKKVIARPYYLSIVQQCRRASLPSMSTESGNHFQSHSRHTLLPPKHPLTINDIGPPIALTMEVIITLPLILGYKYEKLEEERGLKGGESSGKKREESNPEEEEIRLSLCTENDPK